MGAQLIYVTAVGLVASIVLVTLSLRAGRHQPAHRVLWIIALVAIGASLVYRMTIVIGLLFQGTFMDALPILVGELAVAGVFVAVFWRPAWSGWFLITSAFVLPAFNLLLEFLGSSLWERTVSPQMFGFYGLPAIVTGVLLVLSERVSHRHREGVVSS